MYSLGRHIQWQFEGVAPSNPIVSNQGFVIIPDHTNAVRGYTLPERTMDGKIVLNWTFTDSANGAGIISKYSSSPVATGGGRVFWVNTDNSYFWGIYTNTPGYVPVALPFVPVNLTDKSMDKNHFRTWTQETALLFHDNHVWIPATDEHIALAIQVNLGNISHTNLTDSKSRFYGSVGTTENSGHSVAFVSSKDHLVGLSSAAKKLWQSTANFVPAANEFSHPVMIELPGTTDRCVVMSKASASGLQIMGAAPTGGGPCLGWAAQGYTIRTKFTATPGWVSAPAAINDGKGVLLFYSVDLPNADGFKLSALVSIKVDYYGVLSTGDVEDGLFFPDTHINTAPIIAYDAFGFNSPGVVVILGNGDVYTYNHKGFSDGNYRTFYSHYDVLTMPAKSDKGIEVAGNYAAMSSAGSLFFIAYDLSTKDSYLVSICRVFAGYAPYPSSSPIPIVPPSNIVPPTTGTSPAATAGTVFGILGGLGVAAAAIVFLAPHFSFSVGRTTVVPADIIKSGASSTYNGLKSVGSGIANGINRLASGNSTTIPSSYGGGERGALLRVPMRNLSTSAPTTVRTGYQDIGSTAETSSEL